MAEEPTPTSRVGTDARRERIGPYRIDRVLQDDGIGTWYRAEEEDPARAVALRVLHFGVLSTDREVRSFRSEVEAVGRLRHPAISRIHAVGSTAAGQHYYATELIEGEAIDAFVDHNPVTSRSSFRDVRALIQMFRRLCDGVDYAHQRGLIHGRLGPSSVRVSSSSPSGLEKAARSASIKIVDFGVGRSLSARDTPSARSDAETDALTFASPEHLSGEPPDVRGDVYSLGLLLYRILTGARPHVGAGFPLVVLARSLRAEPETPGRLWREMGRRMSHDLEAVILKAVSRDPSRRYANVWALGEDLRRYLEKEPLLAKRATLGYRLRKALDRHKATVAAAAWALLVLIQALLG